MTFVLHMLFICLFLFTIFSGPRQSQGQGADQQEDALLTAFNAARSDSSYSISAVTCLRDLLGKKWCILYGTNFLLCVLLHSVVCFHDLVRFHASVCSDMNCPFSLLQASY